jgi:hypothetical protein
MPEKPCTHNNITVWISIFHEKTYSVGVVGDLYCSSDIEQENLWNSADIKCVDCKKPLSYEEFLKSNEKRDIKP